MALSTNGVNFEGGTGASVEITPEGLRIEVTEDTDHHVWNRIAFDDVYAKLGTSTPDFEKFEGVSVSTLDGGTLANPTHRLRANINLRGDFHEPAEGEGPYVNTSINIVQEPSGETHGML